MDNLKDITGINIAGIGQLTDILLCHLLEYCPKITSLACDGCYNLTDTVFYTIIEHCKNLTTISFDHCPKLTHTALHILGNSELKLTQVSLISCDIAYVPLNFLQRIADQNGTFNLKDNPVLNIDRKYLTCYDITSVKNNLFKTFDKKHANIR